MRLTKNLIEESIQAGRVPLICGGTYFYLQALFAGLLPETEISDTVRLEVEAMPRDAAYERLKNFDAVAAANIHPHNETRLKRALMLCIERNGPISSLQREGAILAEYEVQLIIFDPPRATLKERAAARIEPHDDFVPILHEDLVEVSRRLGAGLHRDSCDPGLAGEVRVIECGNLASSSVVLIDVLE